MRKTEEQILEYLKEHPRGATASEIANETGVNRVTLTKYLNVMRSDGIIEFKQAGMSKLWFLNEMPLVSLLESRSGCGAILKPAFDSLDIGITVMDKNKNVLWVNKKAKEITGREEIKGEKCFELFHKKGKKDCKTCVCKGKGPNNKNYEFRIAPLKQKRKTIGFIEFIREMEA